MAMEKGVILAIELGLENVILEGDSMQILQAVKDKDCTGMVGHIIFGIDKDIFDINVFFLNSSTCQDENTSPNNSSRQMSYSTSMKTQRCSRLRSTICWKNTFFISSKNMN